MNEQWSPTSENSQINNTINILKVELGKESPDSWARIRSQLVEHAGDMN